MRPHVPNWVAPKTGSMSDEALVYLPFEDGARLLARLDTAEWASPHQSLNAPESYVPTGAISDIEDTSRKPSPAAAYEDEVYVAEEHPCPECGEPMNISPVELVPRCQNCDAVEARQKAQFYHDEISQPDSTIRELSTKLESARIARDLAKGRRPLRPEDDPEAWTDVVKKLETYSTRYNLVRIEIFRLKLCLERAWSGYTHHWNSRPGRYITEEDWEFREEGWLEGRGQRQIEELRETLKAVEHGGWKTKVKPIARMYSLMFRGAQEKTRRHEILQKFEEQRNTADFQLEEHIVELDSDVAEEKGGAGTSDNGKADATVQGCDNDAAIEPKEIRHGEFILDVIARNKEKRAAWAKARAAEWIAYHDEQRRAETLDEQIEGLYTPFLNEDTTLPLDPEYNIIVDRVKVARIAELTGFHRENECNVAIERADMAKIELFFETKPDEVQECSVLRDARGNEHQLALSPIREVEE